MTVDRALLLLRGAAVVLVAMIVQAGVVSHLSLFGVRPELTLLLAVSAGVALGPDRGAVVGFVLGVSYDLFLQTPLGLSALIYALLAFAVGTIQLQMATRRRLARMLFMGVGTAVGIVVWVVAGRLLDAVWATPGTTIRVALVAGLVNSVLGLPLIRVWGWVFAPEAPVRVPT